MIQNLLQEETGGKACYDIYSCLIDLWSKSLDMHCTCLSQSSHSFAVC